MIKRLVKVNLPNEYQQVKYISSDGNSYLNVDLRVDEGDVLTYDVDVKYEASDERRLMGGNPNFESYFGVFPDGTLQYFNINVVGQKINYKMTIDTVNLVVTHIYNNEQTHTQESSISQLVTDSNCLFDLSGFGYRGSGQFIYCAKFTKNNILVRHLIPCYRKADNVVGMYDLVSNTFFTNAGTGEFIVGEYNNTETVVTNRDTSNIETVTATETIEYSEKEHIDYDGSESTKEITVNRPCKIYLGFECKNSEQTSGGAISTPYALNYQIKVGEVVYDSRKPNMTSTGGDFEYVLIDITDDMIPYTTSITFCSSRYPKVPLKRLGQIIHLYSDIYYKQNEEVNVKVMKEIKSIKRIHTLLPKEYQQVEYLESTGTQYIDTNYIPNSNTSIKLSFQITKSQVAGIIGSGEEWNTTDNFIFGPAYGDCFWGYAGGANNIRLWQSNYNFTDTYNVYMDITKFIVESNSVEYTAITNKTEIINPTRSIHIFKANTENGNLKNGSSIKLFKTEINENGILIQNYIPCYRKADNVAGMYDLVSNTFFTNAGTGEFIVGGVVLKEIKAIKRYIPDVGLVTLFGNNLFELRKFVSFDAYIGDSIHLLEALEWNEGFINNDSGYEGFRSGEPRQGNFSHMYSEPIALQKGDTLNYICTVGPAATEGALYSNSDANADSFVRYAQRGEVITEDGLYFRGCYDKRENKGFLLIRKTNNNVLAISKGVYGDNFITDANNTIGHNKSVLKYGHTYKISFDAKCFSSPSRTLWLHYADDINSTDTSQPWEWTINGTGDWEHIEFEYTPSIKDMSIRLYAPFSGGALTQYYRNIVIEKIR